MYHEKLRAKTAHLRKGDHFPIAKYNEIAQKTYDEEPDSVKQLVIAQIEAEVQEQEDLAQVVASMVDEHNLDPEIRQK